MNLCINILRANKHYYNYVQNILVHLHPQRQGFDIYADGITNSLHIMASISISYARYANLNVYATCDFLLLVSIILTANHRCFWFMLIYE